MARARRLTIWPLAAVALALAAGTSCAPPCDTDGDCPDGAGCREGYCAAECRGDEDCEAGSECGPNHLCGPPAAGAIVWLSPGASESVEASFDAELEVSFRAASASFHLERGPGDPGERCAPFVPVERELLGDPQHELTQRVSLTGLHALGEHFMLRATLMSSGGAVVSDHPLSGPPSGTGGARFTQPEAERTFDATAALAIEVSAVLERPATVVSLWVEPQGGAPGPMVALGPALTELAAQPVAVVHGPQVVWLDADGARCGLGIDGVGASSGALELALSYHADEPGQLGMRLLVESDGASAACDFREPGERCEAVRETVAPAPRGEQVLRVPIADGMVQVAVVPGAATGYVNAEVRVSMAGVHLGWLGPYPIATGVGEAWIAGQVLVAGGVARLLRTDEVTIGAPW